MRRDRLRPLQGGKTSGLFDLTGRVAIVTGGNGGIGLGMAKGMAQAGASIVVAARDEAKNGEAVRALEELGAQAVAVQVDVTEEASCRAMVQAAVERFGRLDVLVNNAGTNIRKQPEEYTIEEWHLLLETNLTQRVHVQPGGLSGDAAGRAGARS